MAYQARTISPLDLRPSVGVGVAIPFSAKNVFTTVYTTKEQIKYNLINFLLTGKRERVFQPEFGAGLRDLLFEPITTDTSAKVEAIINIGIRKYFPNIITTEVVVTPYYDQNTINVLFRYSIANTGQTDEIFLNFENGK